MLQATRPYPGPVFTCLLCCLMMGCTVVGPKSIRSGRMAYNEAISETNNQQILKLVVQDRYEERGNLLAVSSVTANVKVSSRAGIQAGFGSIDNYAGNLVPFSGGFITKRTRPFPTRRSQEQAICAR